jgi:hypothetical protein
MERRERQILKMSCAAPNMTRLLIEIGQDLVQEVTYGDIVHARNLPEAPKNMDTYKQVHLLVYYFKKFGKFNIFSVPFLGGSSAEANLGVTEGYFLVLNN